MSRVEKRVILIGIDGADYFITKEFLEKGHLENLSKLAKKGLYNKLISTIPPLSPSAWTSIFTGTPPQTHGIFSFTKRWKDTYFPRPITSRDRRVEAVWNILSKYNKKSVLINIPFAYPPEPINGIFITGLGTPSKNSTFTYPPEFRNFIIEKYPTYDVDFGEDRIDKEKPYSVLEKIRVVTDAQIELSKNLFKNKKWDFFSTIFRSIDVIQHFFIKNKKIILEHYKPIDDFVGWVIENMDTKRDLLLICSDHGFSYSHTNFNVNAWLKNKGYLKVTHHPRKAQKILPSAEKIKQFIARTNVGRNIVYRLKNMKILRYALNIFPSEITVSSIDWEHTKAYFWDGSFGLIFINLRGREPKGIVGKEEYDKVVDSIIKDIESARDPRTNKHPIKKAHKGKIFFKTNKTNIPDIVLERNKGYCLRAGLFEEIFQKKVIFPGDHDMYGVFFAYGGDFVSTRAVQKVRDVTHITPIILSFLGIPQKSYLRVRTLSKIRKFKAPKKKFEK